MGTKPLFDQLPRLPCAGLPRIGRLTVYNQALVTSAYSETSG